LDRMALVGADAILDEVDDEALLCGWLQGVFSLTRISQMPRVVGPTGCHQVSVPLPLTGGVTGAFDLYLRDSDDLAELSLGDVSAVSDEIAARLLAAQTVEGSVDSLSGESEPAWLHGPASRRRADVWVAVGMLMTRMDAPAPDALAVLRGYAYAHGVVLDDLAGSLLNGSVDANDVFA
jgi:hypothetical protein